MSFQLFSPPSCYYKNKAQHEEISILGDVTRAYRQLGPFSQTHQIQTGDELKKEKEKKINMTCLNKLLGHHEPLYSPEYYFAWIL